MVSSSVLVTCNQIFGDPIQCDLVSQSISGGDTRILAQCGLQVKVVALSFNIIVTNCTVDVVDYTVRSSYGFSLEKRGKYDIQRRKEIPQE